MDERIDLTQGRDFSSGGNNIINTFVRSHLLEWTSIRLTPLVKEWLSDYYTLRRKIIAHGNSLIIENVEEIKQYYCPRCGRRVINQYDLCDKCIEDSIANRSKNSLFKKEELRSVF